MWPSRAGGEPVARALLDHPPGTPEARAEWRLAIASIAGRLGSEDLRRLHETLAGDDSLRDVCESALLAAANLAPDGTPVAAVSPPLPGVEEVRVEAEFLLTADYLRWREAGKARVLLARLQGREGLSDAQKGVVALGRLGSMLQQRAWDEAAAHTASLIAPEGTIDAALARVWLDEAQFVLQQGSPEEANTILTHIETLFAERLDVESLARLRSFRDRSPTPAMLGPG